MSTELLEPDRETLAVLARAEREIDLLKRVTPRNAEHELARLADCLSRGARLEPALEYDPAPELGSLRSELARAVRVLESRGTLSRLYAERAAELELEARIAEHAGNPELRLLAAARFAEPSAHVADACGVFVDSALSLPEPHESELHRSDDWDDPRSLCATLSRRAREADVRVRIEIVSGQLATATAGEGIVGVRPGVLLSRASAERIAVHELFGHAMPRDRARHAVPELLRIGSARSSETEEGRALLLEERATLMNVARKRELALRHLAAVSTRAGSSFGDTARALVARGAPARQALEVTLRAQRGGGLAREVVYLPAWLEVRAELSSEPALEAWLERGRLSVAAARTLAALG